jgi:hypothetical protein
MIRPPLVGAPSHSQGSNSGSRLCGISAMRARTSASQASGSMSLSFRCHDQRRHSRRPIGSAFGSGEQPRLTSESKTAQRPLGSVVAQTDPSILEEACKAVPALEQIVDRLDDSGRSRQASTLFAQPSLQLGKERSALLLPRTQALLGAGAVDGAPSERLSLTINVRLCRTARRCASPLPARSAVLPALPCHAAHWR